ncbi:MAG: hypothetical protein ABSE76_00265 [Minisyncoccia bacterium]|jgi:hypothetical protein
MAEEIERKSPAMTFLIIASGAVLGYFFVLPLVWDIIRVLFLVLMLFAAQLHIL